MFVDIAVIVVLLISIIIAVLRGFIREVLTILGMFGGAVAAYIGGPAVAPMMRSLLGVEEGVEPEKLFDAIPYDMVADGLGYFVVFVAFLIILSVLSHFLSAFVKTLGLGAVDRALGAAFGVLRGILVLGLLYLPVHKLVEVEEYEWLSSSQTRVYLAPVSEWILSLIPSSDVGDGESGEPSKAHKIIKDMDLLKNLTEPSDEKSSADPQKDGYNADFREGMDKIIEDVTQGKENLTDKKPQYNE